MSLSLVSFHRSGPAALLMLFSILCYLFDRDDQSWFRAWHELELKHRRALDDAVAVLPNSVLQRDPVRT